MTVCSSTGFCPFSFDKAQLTQQSIVSYVVLAKWKPTRFWPVLGTAIYLSPAALYALHSSFQVEWTLSSDYILVQSHLSCQHLQIYMAVAFYSIEAQHFSKSTNETFHKISTCLNGKGTLIHKIYFSFLMISDHFQIAPSRSPRNEFPYGEDSNDSKLDAHVHFINDRDNKSTSCLV